MTTSRISLTFVMDVIVWHRQAHSNLELKTPTSGLFYKHITIVNYNSSVINKFAASLTDYTRIVIYDRHMIIVQATVFVMSA
jgi:hypothetical protein